MWNYGKTPEDGVETHNQPRGFTLAFVTFLAPVGRSVVVVAGEGGMLGGG